MNQTVNARTLIYIEEKDYFLSPMLQLNAEKVKAKKVVQAAE